MEIHTVNGNSNTFGQFIPVSPNKGWDFAKRVELRIILRKIVGRSGFDDFEFQIIGLGDGENGTGTSIPLRRIDQVSKPSTVWFVEDE